MEKLRNILEKNKQKYIDRLSELVAIDTHDLGHGVQGGLEKKGQDYIAELFREMGASVSIDPIKEADIEKCYSLHHEGNLGHNQDNRYNVYALFRGEKPGRKLLFNGHMDVMPADNVSEWTTPPFEPSIREGKMYGRGTADMKGGLLAATMAVQLLKDASISLLK